MYFKLTKYVLKWDVIRDKNASTFWSQSNQNQDGKTFAFGDM